MTGPTMLPSPVTTLIGQMRALAHTLAQYSTLDGPTVANAVRLHDRYAEQVLAATARDPRLDPRYREPGTTEADVDLAVAWSEYRADYGVSADPEERAMQHKLFAAGFRAARSPEGTDRGAVR